LFTFSSSKPVRFGVALPFSNDNKENNHPDDYDHDASNYADGDGPVLYRDDGTDYDGEFTVTSALKKFIDYLNVPICLFNRTIGSENRP